MRSATGVRAGGAGWSVHRIGSGRSVGTGMCALVVVFCLVYDLLVHVRIGFGEREQEERPVVLYPRTCIFDAKSCARWITNDKYTVS